MAWNKIRACSTQPGLTKLPLRTFLGTAEPSHGEGHPSGHPGTQNEVPEGNLKSRLSAFFDETEEIRRRKGPGRHLWVYRGHQKNVI